MPGPGALRPTVSAAHVTEPLVRNHRVEPQGVEPQGRFTLPDSRPDVDAHRPSWERLCPGPHLNGGGLAVPFAGGTQAFPGEPRQEALAGGTSAAPEAARRDVHASGTPAPRRGAPVPGRMDSRLRGNDEGGRGVRVRSGHADPGGAVAEGARRGSIRHAGGCSCGRDVRAPGGQAGPRRAAPRGSCGWNVRRTGSCPGKYSRRRDARP